jgi:hypothetical protein
MKSDRKKQVDHAKEQLRSFNVSNQPKQSEIEDVDFFED